MNAGNPLSADWPEPPAAARKISDRLIATIRDEIREGGGSMGFSRFMELALYYPGLGYYSGGMAKFGREGDFVTAPQVSPAFSFCIARHCHEVLEALEGGAILEFGAGDGTLAAQVLEALGSLGVLPEQYLILEVSGELRERQRHTLEQSNPEWLARVRWLDALPRENFQGVVLANEVLDAMPVNRFRWTGTAVEEARVAWQNNAFAWMYSRASAELERLAGEIADILQLPPDYISELSSTVEPWIRTVGGLLQRGQVLLGDYGYGRGEYYQPERARGTLLCHYRHRCHDDPFIYVGLQDITAHVEFTRVAEAAVAAGLSVNGFVSQAQFLLDTGLEDYLSGLAADNSTGYLAAVQGVKTLMLPGEMGERFRFMALGKGMTATPIGFRGQDLRHGL